jgi:hypothetical protein
MVTLGGGNGRFSKGCEEVGFQGLEGRNRGFFWWTGCVASRGVVF